MSEQTPPENVGLLPDQVVTPPKPVVAEDGSKGYFSVSNPAWGSGWEIGKTRRYLFKILQEKLEKFCKY